MFKTRRPVDFGFALGFIVPSFILRSLLFVIPSVCSVALSRRLLAGSMGAACCKEADTVSDLPGRQREDSTLRTLFDRFDVDNSGYIDKENLKQVLKDDKWMGNEDNIDRILEKYGTDGKITFQEFQNWWHSSYTT